MKRIRLIHWNDVEARTCLERLRNAGYEPEFDTFSNETLHAIKEDPPDAFVIDLSRLPSQGRDLGFTFRKTKATRQVPIIFSSGLPEKVAHIRSHFPDAIFCNWDTIRNAIEEALIHPPVSPKVPESVFEAYRSTPLPKKLGIKPNSRVLLVDAPGEIERTLGELPDGVRLKRDTQDLADITLWFVRSRDMLMRKIEEMNPFARSGGLWIIWPKKSSGVENDVSQQVVRQAGLDNGMVDYKICSIDEVWSGLRFTQRKSG